MKNLIKNKLVVVLGLIVVVFALYYPALWNDYVWDDVIIFVDRTFWYGDHSFWYMVSQPVLEGTSYFRPLVFATFVVEFKLWGLKPFASHLINLIIFSCNISLVYLVSYKIAQLLNKVNPNIYAIILALLYVTSPILIESTVWAVGRFDLMVTSFILLGIFTYLKLDKTWLRDFLLSIFFICGLLSKELAVVFPVIIFLLELSLTVNKSFQSRIFSFFKENYRLVIFFGVTFLIYLLIRITAMGQMYHAMNAPLSEPLSKIEYVHVLLPLNTFYEYVKTFFIPFYPNAIHQIDYSFIADWRGKIASIFALVVLGSLIYTIVRKNIFSAYMALCSVLCLLPVLRIIPLGVPETIIHERFMTTALFFVLLAIVFLPWNEIFEKLKISRMKSILLGFLLFFYICLGALGVHFTIPMWKNNLILWQWAYENNKTSSIALQSYLTYLYEYKKYPEFVKVIDERRRDITMSSEVLYYAYLLENRDPETKNYIDGMINSLNPLHAMIKDRSEYSASDNRLTEIGSIYHLNAYYYVVMGSDLKQALKNVDIALWYDPENKQYHVIKSLILLGMGQQKESDIAWAEAMKDVHISKQENFLYQREQLIIKMCQGHLMQNKDLCHAGTRDNKVKS